jgi:HPt (histidine-containing phosphotransfer) domain-containing protein
MAEAMARLWAKFLPDIEQRVAVVEAAAQAAAAGTLSEADREAAHAAAHKLAGSLGTFGLQRGTELAREAELAFTGTAELDTQKLSAWIAELRILIDGRK